MLFNCCYVIIYTTEGDEVMQLTFIGQKYLEGDNKLEIFDKYGLKSAVTDFSILLGIDYGDEYPLYCTGNDNNLEQRTGAWWTKICIEPRAVQSARGFLLPVLKVSRFGEFWDGGLMARNVGARPMVFYSEVKNNSTTIVNLNENILEIGYGEYPQMVTTKFISFILEKLYCMNKLKETGKIYTTDSVNVNVRRSIEFQPRKHIEYMFNGKKYIRFIGDSNCIGKTLSNGTEIKEGIAYWIEVEPIRWLVDKKQDVAITKKILFSGIQFNNDVGYKTESDFENMDIKKFLDEYFSKEIMTSKLILPNEKSHSINKNEFNTKIQLLLEEIDEYLVNVQNKEKIQNNINNLLENYNENLKKIQDIQGLTLYSEESLKNELVVNLNIILDKLKNYYENNKIYYEILDYLRKLIAVVNGEEIEEDNNLIKDFNIIMNYCIPFLKTEDRNKIVNDIAIVLTSEIERLTNYLKYVESFSDDIYLKIKNNYSSYNEFEIILRKRIHSIFLELNDKVRKRDIELEIYEGLKDIRQNLFLISTNKTIAIYLKEINDLKLEIDELLVKLGKEKMIYSLKLSNILYVNIDCNKEIEQILKDVSNIIISLHKLIFEINKRLNSIDKYNNNYVKIKIKN